MQRFQCFLTLLGSLITCAIAASVVNFPNARSPVNTILGDPTCTKVHELCNSVKEADDLLILECLYALEPRVLAQIDEKCQHTIWNHTQILIDNKSVRGRIGHLCDQDLQSIKCPDDHLPGSLHKCLALAKHEITNRECRTIVDRLENVSFNDYPWIEYFLDTCRKDIADLQCGRIDAEGFTQSETIVCLQNQFERVGEGCRNEVLKVTEIQADNIKFDRQLYLACTEDYMKYCRRFTPGTGRVFKCLLQHRGEKLEESCMKQLLRREKLIARDFRVSKGLMRACRDDIKKSHCRKQTSDDRATRLAQVLLCLENVVRNGTKIDSDCELEMVDHRKMLMEDYRLSPEIVDGCSIEIRKFCSGLETGGKTIHCLMEHARFKNKKKRITDNCQRALEDLVKETDAGEDWRVDPILHEACYPVVKVVCPDVRSGNARVMSCLMDNIGTDHMTEECENALMQIQYFVARDFKLDPQLYRACKQDATNFCHAKKDWSSAHNYDVDNGPLVLPCLYRYAYRDHAEMQLKPACSEQIRRVMRQRAFSVDLQPEIEEACMADLSDFCFDKTAKGEEILCLQRNMDELQDTCKKAVTSYTEAEGQHVELNPYIMTYCRRALETHCATEMKHDEGDAMECLIAHKNDADVKANSKCRVNIEHFQILALKDYHFSYKFKTHCKNYAMRFCSDAKSKAAVVTCLSEKVRNDTLNNVKSDIQKECRQQLRAQLFQQRENINFMPKLKAACEKDIKKHCGSEQILECLQGITERLTPECEKELFKIKRQEMLDNSVDYALMTMCAETIEQFCTHTHPDHVLNCLKRHKDENGFSKKCRLVVMHRLVEQNSDYRLNPSLEDNCKPDIRKFCQEKIAHADPNRELNGEVIKCLKVAFRQSRLTSKCEREMTAILREQALDVRLNPLLLAVCKDELETICRLDDDESTGAQDECLKNALLEHRIPTPACQVEVASMIEESQADIQVDPFLQQACSLDLMKSCGRVKQGRGRHIKCLKIILENNSDQLTSECKSMLSKRLEMYRNAAEVAPPENFQELYSQVVASPSRHYFITIILMALAMFFVVGIFCGRVSKKHMMSKNK